MLAATLSLLLLVGAPPARAGEAGGSGDAEIEAAIARLGKVVAFRRDGAPTPEQVALGKKLFFDPKLSVGGKMACATCHKPEHHYGEGLPRSIGRGGKPVARNAPSLINARLYMEMFWDGRAETIEDASLIALQNPLEMAQPAEPLARRLREDKAYAAAFAAAYPGVGVSSTTIGAALGAFVLSVAAPEDSAFDRFLKDRTGLSESARRGFVVFAGRGGCIQCHTSSHLNYNRHYHNIGLAPDGADDPGRYAVEARPDMWGAFRVPSLRNVALTGPYMHDGRFSTLDDVIDYYDRGGDGGRYQNPQIGALGLSRQEREDLKAFLLSLTSARLAANGGGR